MDIVEKISLLKDATRHEPAGDEVPGSTSRLPRELVGCISHVVSPHNPRMPVLKGMATTACERNCQYCVFRSGRDGRRVSFTPDEMAKGFYQLYRAGLVEGLFLSSGLARDGVPNQDKIIATAEILRFRYHFRGYMHLKIMPGAEFDQVARTMQLADRVSVNLESPNPERLAVIAPKKSFSGELMQRLRWIEGIRRQNGGKGPSSITQFVVGPAGESDLELLHTTQFVQREFTVKRAYFSAFAPVPETPLEGVAPTPLDRQHRLYQCSFLLRDYAFEVEELVFDRNGNLPLNQDPKMAWAQENLTNGPVELNVADRAQLLRVPGIGPKGASRILAERRRGTLRNLEDLRKIGVVAGRAAPFITLDGHRPPVQLRFW